MVRRRSSPYACTRHIPVGFAFTVPAPPTHPHCAHSGRGPTRQRQPTRVTTGAEVGAGEDLDPDVFLGDHATAVVKISTHPWLR